LGIVSRRIPKHYQVQFSAAQIAAQVARLGDEVTAWVDAQAARTGRDPVAVPVLRGGIFFFADLTRAVRSSIEVAPGRTKAYDTTTNEAVSQPVLVQLEGVDLRGRAVLLVDDICDSGRTLQALNRYISEAGAIEVRSAVLIHRDLEQSVFSPDWAAFAYKGSEWFVGYGMEDRNAWSNLPEIYIVRETGAKAVP
jgi:hypoxanthine phosphoribosyltransferase